jgi:hypothetical protein
VVDGRQFVLRLNARQMLNRSKKRGTRILASHGHCRS